MTLATLGQSAVPRVGFIGWGAESTRAWQALSSKGDVACWLPAAPDTSVAGQLPSAIRLVGSIEALCSGADWLFLEGDPTQLAQAVHTMRLALTDRHILAVLGTHWRLRPLLEQLHDRKLLRCMVLAAGHESAIGAGETVEAAAPTGYSGIAMHAASTVNPAEAQAFRALFGDPGQVVELREEAQFDVMQALGGFAPAAFLSVLDSMADGVRMLGVPRASAVRLLSALLLDAVSSVLNGSQTLAEMREEALVEDVAAAGLMELELAGVRGHMMRAVNQAVRHAREAERDFVT